MVIPQNDKAKLGARLWQTTPAKGKTTIPMRTQSSQETDHTDCPKRSEFPLSQPSDCPKSWRNALALRTVPGVTECPIKVFGGYRELLDRPTCSSVKHKQVRRTVPGVTDRPMDQRIALALRTVEGPRKKRSLRGQRHTCTTSSSCRACLNTWGTGKAMALILVLNVTTIIII